MTTICTETVEINDKLLSLFIKNNKKCCNQSSSLMDNSNFKSSIMSSHYLPRFMSPTIIEPTELLSREIKSILNKMNYQNLNKLIIKIINLGINSVERLLITFNLVYDKVNF
jgi:hypothetical protein